jgi:hypothetical protein
MLAAAGPARRSLAEWPREVRDRNAQPAVESAGLGLDLDLAAREARVKKLESAVPRDEATAEALAAYATAIDELRQAADRGSRADDLARLRDLPQNTRTGIEARARPSSMAARVGALAGRAPEARS